MAPIGGGPPIGSTGGTFTGAAQALEIYGDFAAAFTGAVNIDTSPVTVLSFTTGNYLFVGEITMNAGIEPTNTGDGSISIYTLSFNGVDIMYYKNDAVQEDMPIITRVPIIIPAYTEVALEVLSNGDTGGYFTTACITGRIYRD